MGILRGVVALFGGWSRSLSYGPFGGQENDRIFRGSFSSLADLITSITTRIAKWALVRKEFYVFTLNDIILNWEAYIGCGSLKVRNIARWSSPPLGGVKFNVDGAVRGKARQASIGGVLCNSKGEV